MATIPAPLTRHITKLFREATPEQIIAGADWYTDAHAVADALAVRYGVTLEVAAGVLAALSPLQSWGANVNLAARFLAAGGLHAGYLGVGLAKGRAILAGADIVATLKGDKIVNFYPAIVTKGAQGVAIDRHAWSIAVNTRSVADGMPSLSGKRYAAAVSVYVRATDILSKEYGMALTPAQVQAVTWILWRNKFWAVGAFDKHEAV